jgi:Cu(I)/Ag(I) efflux system membrane protein CusA/SilA
VSLVIIVFLFHFRSALIPILTLPIALVISFIPMYYLNVSSNIMSLGGLALAIGVLVDAAIVMVENGYRHLSERPASGGEASEKMNSNGPVLHKETAASAGKPMNKAVERERVRTLIDAAKQVGPALFFSLLIIVASFLPVFLLEAQEGRMFRPLAWTKTLAFSAHPRGSVRRTNGLVLVANPEVRPWEGVMLGELQRRNYSEITARKYLQVVTDFAKHFGKSPDLLTITT